MTAAGMTAPSGRNGQTYGERDEPKASMWAGTGACPYSGSLSFLGRGRGVVHRHDVEPLVILQHPMTTVLRIGTHGDAVSDDSGLPIDANFPGSGRHVH